MAKYFLIYDDNCSLCSEATRKVRSMDRLGLVESVPLSIAVETGKCPQNLAGQLGSKVHLIGADGQVWAGADALGRLASLFPSSRRLGKFILLPGVIHLASPIYVMIARRRLRSCSTARKAEKTPKVSQPPGSNS